MDLATLSEWLKTTVPGIVLLGAIGSIVAAIAIMLARRYLLPAFISWVVKSIAGFFSHFAEPAARQLAVFILHKGTDKLQLFYLLQLMKFVLALFLGTCAFILFAFALSQSDENLARASILVPLITSFLCLWYGLRCIAIVMLPMYFDIDGNRVRLPS